MHGFEVSVVHACSGVPGVVMGLPRLFCTWAQAAGLHDTRRVNLREHRAIVSTNKPRAPGLAKDVSATSKTSRPHIHVCAPAELLILLDPNAIRATGAQPQSK